MKASAVLRDVAHAEGVQGAVDNFVDKWISLWKICYSWGFNLLLRALVSMSRLYQAQFRLEIVLSL